MVASRAVSHGPVSPSFLRHNDTHRLCGPSSFKLLKMQVRWVPGSLWLGLDSLLYASPYYTCCLSFVLLLLYMLALASLSRVRAVLVFCSAMPQMPIVVHNPLWAAMDTWGSSSCVAISLDKLGLYCDTNGDVNFRSFVKLAGRRSLHHASVGGHAKGHLARPS